MRRRALTWLSTRRQRASHLAESLYNSSTARRAQDVFRSALMDYWNGRCPLTGTTDPALLRASHIVPWSDCNDEQRLDVHNGLLLSALWDAAFDCGLVSFADNGSVLASSQLSETSRRS
jgi:putative restriction endonuclease